jgi:hypothetical protein
VTDLAQFQKVFDRLRADREAVGLTDLGQFCAADEPDVVIVVMEVANVAGAKKYWHSDILAQGRADAGIVGPIEAKSDQVWLTDGLVKDRLVKPKRRRRPVDSEAHLADGTFDPMSTKIPAANVKLKRSYAPPVAAEPHSCR